ncbi:MAG: hypothetical protein WCJ64_17060 [Rhodospirillaceae bacterium]
MGYLREEPGAGNPHARICEGEAEWHNYSTVIFAAGDGRNLLQEVASVYAISYLSQQTAG